MRKKATTRRFRYKQRERKRMHKDTKIMDNTDALQKGGVMGCCCEKSKKPHLFPEVIFVDDSLVLTQHAQFKSYDEITKEFKFDDNIVEKNKHILTSFITADSEGDHKDQTTSKLSNSALQTDVTVTPFNKEEPCTNYKPELGFEPEINSSKTNFASESSKLSFDTSSEVSNNSDTKSSSVSPKLNLTTYKANLMTFANREGHTDN